MHRPAFISEAIATYHEDGRELEVCATAEGRHDAGRGRLLVDLDCFVRPVGIREREWHRHPDWLPAAQHAEEGVAEEESSDLLRDVFRRWVVRVREAHLAERERVVRGPGEGG